MLLPQFFPLQTVELGRGGLRRPHVLRGGAVDGSTETWWGDWIGVVAHKMDPEVWVHHYDLENKRVAPETVPVINFGRPSQDMAGAPSTALSSSTPTAPGTGAEPTLKTPAAPTPSRVATGGSQAQEELTKHLRNPRGTGFQMKKVATKSPAKSTSTSTAQAKDKSPAKDSSAPAKKSSTTKDNSLDDY